VDRAIDLNRPRAGSRTAPGNVFESFRRCPFSVKHEELVPGEFSCFERTPFRRTATSGFSLIPHATYLRVS
jgi:hypothetical protein